MLYNLFVVGGPILPPFEEVIEQVSAKLLEFSPICVEYQGHRYFITDAEEAQRALIIYARRNMTASQLYERNLDLLEKRGL